MSHRSEFKRFAVTGGILPILMSVCICLKLQKNRKGATSQAVWLKNGNRVLSFVISLELALLERGTMCL